MKGLRRRRGRPAAPTPCRCSLNAWAGTPRAPISRRAKIPASRRGGPALIIWPGSVQVVWSLGNSLPEGKMTIAADDPGEYAKWIPAPIDDDRFGPASALTFLARILPKEEGKPAPKGKIDFWLRDVSREKGVCLNAPPKGGAEEDLRFAANIRSTLGYYDHPSTSCSSCLRGETACYSLLLIPSPLRPPPVLRPQTSVLKSVSPLSQNVG